MSKTIVLTGFGDYDKLSIEERPKPTKPESGNVIVNVKASSINFAELMAKQGLYDRNLKLPAVLGMEGSGDVVEVGIEVTSLKVGDRVAFINRFGLWTEYAEIPADHCFIIPEKMTYEEAAAIPVNYITAHHILFDFGNLRKGKSVLIHMAAGGVGTAAIQMCKTVPDVTVFGTASASKHDFIRELGCTHPIDYRTKDYVKEIRDVSPKGVDIVMDPLAGEDSVKGFELLKPLGKIVHYGAANIVTGSSRSIVNMIKTWWATKNVNPLGLMVKNKAVCGYHLGYLHDEKDLVRDSMTTILSLYKEGLIKPKIDSVWGFDNIKDAMERMHTRKNIGKVILTPQKPEKEGAAGDDVN